MQEAAAAAAAAAATAAGVALNTAKRDEATRRDAITTRCRVENGAQVFAPIDTESSRECRQCCVCRVRMLRGVDATSAGETLNAPEQNINTRSQPEPAKAAAEQQMDAPPMAGPRQRNATRCDEQTNERTETDRGEPSTVGPTKWPNGGAAATLDAQ